MRPIPLTYLRWLPALGWMALIFIGSTDLLSSDHTSRFIAPLLRWLFRGTLSAQGIEEGHHLIRKTGHLCEYAVLCVLYWWALRPVENASPASARHGWGRAASAVALAAVYAASDEFHQSFVPSRGASVTDVLIDTSGAVTGLSIALVAGYGLRSWRRSPM